MMRLRIFSAILFIACLSASGAWAQDATPEAAAESSFRETTAYTSEDGRLSLRYPAGWLVRERSETEVYFANSEAALSHGFDDPFSEGEIQVGIFAGSITDILPDAELDADEDVLTLMETAVAQASEEDGIEFTQTQLTQINDHPAAEVSFYAAEFAGYSVVVAFADGHFVAVQAITAPGELELWRAKINALVASIRFGEAAESSLALTETAAAEDDLFSLRYPRGWAARPSFPQGIDLGSSEATLDLWLSNSFAPGEAHLSVSYGSLEELFEEMPETVSSPTEILEAGLASGEGDGMEVSEIEELTVNGRPAAAIRAVLEESALVVIIIEYEDGAYLAAQAQTNPDELAELESLLFEILETVQIPA